MFMPLIYLLMLPNTQGEVQPKQQEATITFADDREIKVLISGRSGNLELKSADTETGHAHMEFQKGSGFLAYDRQGQALTCVSKKRFSLNHMSKSITRLAPYIKMNLPRECELDFSLDLTDLGYGSLNFTGLHVKKLHFDVNYGDVDLSFPTENKSIIRERVFIHLMMGDLEIYELGNLKASDVFINAGIGEVTIDMGPKIFVDTMVTLDHDIGASEIQIPKGTFVVIQGTGRDLAPFGFKNEGKIWKSKDHSSEFPMLTLDIQGPMGELDIVWK